MELNEILVVLVGEYEISRSKMRMAWKTGAHIAAQNFTYEANTFVRVYELLGGDQEDFYRKFEEVKARTIDSI